ncbi:MAG: thiol peroxidase [Prolixibacteraceae bacterium]|jgi:thiol peroxidase|nr:thiol peroxidase [Prolixibacteraceae bacterium]
MERNCNLVTYAGDAVTLVGRQVKKGKIAPDFTVLRGDLSPIKLSDYRGMKVVIAVYPTIDNELCKKQNRKMSEIVSTLDNTVLLSISCDLPFAQCRFCATEGLNKIVTLSDHKEVDFGTKYGFLVQEFRLLARGIVVVNEKGVITFVEYVSEITNEPNYEAILKVF